MAQYWKTQGYPAFARHLSTGRDFLVLRRFGEENVLVLLNLQNKIRLAKQRLREIDRRSENDPEPAFQSKNSLTEHVNDRNPYIRERSKVLDELQKLLGMYNDHMLTYAQIRRLTPASSGHIQSLKTWHQNWEYAIDGSERYELEDGASVDYDLVSLTTQENLAFAAILERSSFLRWLLRKKPKPGQHFDDEMESWSHKKLQILSDSISFVLGLGMLIGPMWWLNYSTNPTVQLAIITGFIVLFGLGATVLRLGRSMEVLAATAAYSAVLVVFLQNTQSQALQNQILG